MAFTPYATVDQLATWLAQTSVCDVPSNGAGLLRSATLLVARDINENPYNAVTIDEPRIDATCAQAAAWIAAGIDPAAGSVGIAQTVKSKGVDGATVSYDGPTSVDRMAALTTLCPDAYSILYNAGLLYAPLPVWDACPDAGLYVSELGQIGGRPYVPYLLQP